jgi:hypothetical protein
MSGVRINGHSPAAQCHQDLGGRSAGNDVSGEERTVISDDC